MAASGLGPFAFDPFFFTGLADPPKRLTLFSDGELGALESFLVNRPGTLRSQIRYIMETFGIPEDEARHLLGLPSRERLRRRMEPRKNPPLPRLMPFENI